MEDARDVPAYSRILLRQRNWIVANHLRTVQLFHRFLDVLALYSVEQVRVLMIAHEVGLYLLRRFRWSLTYSL